MNVNEYVVVFDIAKQPYTTWFAGAVGFAFMVIGAGIWRLGEGLLLRAFGLVLATLALAFAIYATVSSWNEYQRLQASARNGAYTDIEGYVEDFQSDRDTRGGPQRFSISGHRFEVWRATMTPAFHATVLKGGPNLSGKCVRIRFTDQNEILWLGIRRAGCPDVERTERADQKTPP